MSSETQLTVSRFAEWLDRVVAHGNWQAEADFIVATLIIHSDAGTRRLTREQYMQSVLSTRTADWRLAIDDLMAYGDRVGCVFKHRDAPSVRGCDRQARHQYYALCGSTIRRDLAGATLC